MKPNPLFQQQDRAFWACVRSLSQDLGYTVRGKNKIKVPTLEEMRAGFIQLGLNAAAIINTQRNPTALGKKLASYFEYRAEVLETLAQENLMNASEAKKLFLEHKRKLKPRCPLPMNKQKGSKRAPAYLTGLVNMFVEYNSKGGECVYDPRKLTTVTRDGVPLRTLSRRVDGAFPNTVNPVAVWEVKEYYYTTTFGSRVADGVYETLLDGMEIEELRDSHHVDIRHYLFIDAKNTWWNDGKAYLCRIVDMMNMGYVDEVIVGREVVAEMPRLVSEWLRIAKDRHPRGDADPAAKS